MSTKSKIKRKKLQYINSATVHGLSRTYNGYFFERIFWAVQLLISFSFVCYGTYDLVAKFQTRAVYIDTNKMIVEEMSLPSITLCNNKRMRFVYQRGSWDVKDDIQTAFSEYSYNFSKAYKSFCYTADMYCSIDDFKAEGTNASCMTVNLKGIFLQKLPGSHYGLNVILYDNNADYESGEELSEGVTVVIHDSNEYPSQFFNGFHISPGVLNNIAVEKVVTNRQPSPYPSNCKNEQVTEEVRFPGVYTHQNCLASCLLRAMYVNCGDVITPKFGRYLPQSLRDAPRPNYTADEVSTCLYDIMHKFNKHSSNRCS